MDINGSGAGGATTGVATAPPGTVDFAGDETGIGGGGISSDAFPALCRVVVGVVFDPFLPRAAAFGGIELQFRSDVGEGVPRKPEVDL